jgi:BRCT domain type II-containing protein
VKVKPSDLGGCRVDYVSNSRDAIDREAAEFGVLADEGVRRGAIDAVDFVASDIALNPLNLVAKFGEHAAGSLRNVAELVVSHVTGAGYISLNHELWHGSLLIFASDLRLVRGKTEVMVPRWRPRVNGARLD